MRLLRDLVNWNKIAQVESDYDFTRKLGIAVGYVLTSYPDEVLYALGKKSLTQDVMKLGKLFSEARKGREPSNAGDLFRFGATIIYALEMAKEDNNLFFIDVENGIKNLDIDDEFKTAITKAVKLFSLGVLEGYNKGRGLINDSSISIEDKIVDVRDILANIDHRELVSDLGTFDDFNNVLLLDKYFFANESADFDNMSNQEKEAFLKVLLRAGEPNVIDLYTRVKAQGIENTHSERFSFGYDDPFTVNPYFFHNRRMP